MNLLCRKLLVRGVHLSPLYSLWVKVHISYIFLVLDQSDCSFCRGPSQDFPRSPNIQSLKDIQLDPPSSWEHKAVSSPCLVYDTRYDIELDQGTCASLKT